MKILFCTWDNICESGITNAMRRLGYDVVSFSYKYENIDYDTDYIKELAKFIQNNKDIDCAFSINFIPIVSRTCKVFNMPYLSWTVDSPCLSLYSKTLAYPTNYIFIFDRIQTEKFSSMNPGHVFHMPLGCDIGSSVQTAITDHERNSYSCDVSFIGSLYSDMSINKYNIVYNKLPDYIKGYVEGLINAQQLIYGYNFIEDSISDEWALEFRKYTDWDFAEDYNHDLKGIVADYYIGYKCTEQERINTLKRVSENFSTDLYTLSDTTVLPNIHNRGVADSGTMMPKIFKCSKINLNITSRTIKSGLPLRIFDIIREGGFVISNYQSEIPEYFTPDEDLILYDSIPDLLNKIDYYLSHDEERTQIAKNGYNKAKEFHTYDIRIQEMLSITGLLPASSPL